MMNWINDKQSKHERKVKYHFLRYSGMKSKKADKLKDWSINKIISYLYTQKIKNGKQKNI